MKNDKTGVKRRAAAVFIITVLCYAGILLYMIQAQKSRFEPKGQDVITIWYWDDSIKELFEQYKKDTGSTYRLNYVNVSISDYARQIESAIDLPGELPDICFLQDYYAGNFLSRPIWENLEQEPYGVEAEEYPQGCKNYMTSSDGTIVALPYNLDAAGLAYRAEMANRVFGIQSAEEAMNLFTDWEMLLKKSVEQKEKGHSFMLFNCLGDVGSMLFNQTNEPYVKENQLVKPERFLEYFRYLDRLYETGLVGDTAQVSMEWSEDYWEETYMMAPWTFWVSQYDTFSVNEKEDWTLICPPDGSFKWGGIVLSIPSSSTEKEAAWDFIRYLAKSMEGAEANKKVKCRQLTYFGCQHGSKEYSTLEIEGFGNQDIGNYVRSGLMEQRKERPLSPYDLELDEVFHLTIDAIIYEPELTPEELYAYFLRMLKKAAPELKVPPI